MVRAQRGDDEAFAEITHVAYPRLLQVAFRILRDRTEAEDATQQACLELWRDLPGLRDAERFDGWAYRVLIRVCYRAADRRRRRSETPIAPHPTVDGGYGQIDDRDLIERAFGALSVDQRTVLVLHYYEGMTLEQVAALLELPLGTVNSRRARALGRIRDDVGARPEDRPLRWRFSR